VLVLAFYVECLREFMACSWDCLALDIRAVNNMQRQPHGGALMKEKLLAAGMENKEWERK